MHNTADSISFQDVSLQVIERIPHPKHCAPYTFAFVLPDGTGCILTDGLTRSGADLFVKALREGNVDFVSVENSINAYRKALLPDSSDFCAGVFCSSLLGAEPPALFYSKYINRTLKPITIPYRPLKIPNYPLLLVYEKSFGLQSFTDLPARTRNISTD